MIFRPSGTDFTTDFVADFLSCVFLRRKDGFCDGFWDLVSLAKDGKRVENNLRVKVHSRIHNQNPCQAPSETCCLKFRKLEKAVAVSGVCFRGFPRELRESHGKLVETLFPNREMLQILVFWESRCPGQLEITSHGCLCTSGKCSPSCAS